MAIRVCDDLMQDRLAIWSEIAVLPIANRDLINRDLVAACHIASDYNAAHGHDGGVTMAVSRPTQSVFLGRSVDWECAGAETLLQELGSFRRRLDHAHSFYNVSPRWRRRDPGEHVENGVRADHIRLHA